ncbi:hypothetical protein QE152_g30631 [Popillia japonica]|uniref:Uncharacterized protein n=1 Tax=Popillia japonica TaxID=7064 RepID=A0AAW1JE80_POPJA
MLNQGVRPLAAASPVRRNMSRPNAVSSKANPPLAPIAMESTLQTTGIAAAFLGLEQPGLPQVSVLRLAPILRLPLAIHMVRPRPVGGEPRRSHPLRRPLRPFSGCRWRFTWSVPVRWEGNPVEATP